MNSSLSGRFVIDGSHRVIEWELGAAALLGIPAELAVGRRCYEVVQGYDEFGRRICGPSCRSLAALAAGRLLGHSYVAIHRPAGPHLRLRCELVALPAGDGAVAMLGHVGPGASIGRDLDITSLLSGVLASAPPPDNLWHVPEVLREASGAEAGELFLAEPGGHGMVLTCHQGVFRHAFSQITHFEPGEGFPGLALAQGAPVFSDHLLDDPRFLRSRVKEAGFQQYVCMPLRSSSGVVGSIGLAFRRPDPALSHTLRLLSWASGPVALALEAGLLRMQRALFLDTSQGTSGGEDNAQSILGRVMDTLLPLSGAQGMAVVLLPQTRSASVQRVTRGATPRGSCQALSSVPISCPASARACGTVLAGPRASWPAPCQDSPRSWSVCYCIPAVARGRPISICQFYYHSTGTSVPTRSLAWLQAAIEAVTHSIRVAHELYEEEQRAQTYSALTPAGPKGSAVALAPHMPERDALSSLRRPAEAGPYLVVRCLGTFELRKHGMPVTPAMIARKKALTLLKILLTKDGRPLSRETLIDLLWPEGDPQTKTGQLHVLVHELRRLVEPPETNRRWQFIVGEGDRYYFSARSSCRVDAWEFKLLAEEGRTAGAKGDRDAAISAYEAAVQLYRGDFMEDEPFAEWCLEEREQTRETCIFVLRRLAALHRSAGNWHRSIELLRRALRMDPVREEVHRALMQALWADGRRDEALRQYQTCKESLARELSVAPLPETEKLAERIRSLPAP
ncbi:MAG: GAF domain-containing protein [Chloroflexi bacterium]|nr:GAF domain-containing protein [Chloroflexota bacterium]